MKRTYGWQMTHEKSSVSLAFREILIKTTKRDHNTPFKMPKIKNSDNTNC
jgi:hypothetical protein